MESSQTALLDKTINQFSEKEKNLVDSNRFVYIFSKAWLYTKLGPEKYRKDDAFNQPPVDFDHEDLEVLANGCRQVLEGVGLTIEKPFTEIDVMGFSALFRLFHFKNIQRKCKHGFIFNGKRGALDSITFQHVIDGSKVVYYNFCEYPSFD
jgi:hypothetical protein